MFKIGDKVRVIKDYYAASVGDEGIIRALPNHNGSTGYTECYSVEFPSWCSVGHKCNGTVPSGQGQWVMPECLELIKSAHSEKIVITHDGKTTLARLYEDNKVVKSAEAKCSPDDEFDFLVGAKVAFERLTGTTPKVEPPKFDKSMLTNGRFGYMEKPGWFVVVGDKIVYEKGGYDLLEKMSVSGRYFSYEVKYIVESEAFNYAREMPTKVIWCAPDFDPKEAQG
jgi:hypothetical protein